MKLSEVCQHNLISKSVFPFKSDPSDARAAQPRSAYLHPALLLPSPAAVSPGLEAHQGKTLHWGFSL